MKTTITCKNCGKVFDINLYDKQTQSFCSRKCYQIYRTGGVNPIRICQACGKEFKSKIAAINMGWGKYCSLKCSITSGLKKRWGDGRNETIECLNCSKIFTANISEKRKYCSHKCYSENKIGIVLSKELVEKMNKNKKGKKPKNFGVNFGVSRERHHNWKGGATSINETIRKSDGYKKWRDSVFMRDNYTCQVCGSRCGKGNTVILHAHHIKSFSKYKDDRFDINNGITMCTMHHYDKYSKEIIDSRCYLINYLFNNVQEI